MIIKKLRASFGKLKGSLELKEGYNELCLPNEAGKSTWSAFLVAMLYGIANSERPNAQNQGLPAKERYRPWDGSPMEGAIELEWNGRAITIERSTAGRVPMGKFTAYETASGTPIPELTGENCGRILCGVERSVFERSAFIRQLGLAVSPDAALEKRLGALVTTGEEDGLSCSQLEKELKNRRNKLIGRSGRITKNSATLNALEERLGDLRRMQEEAMELTARKEAREQELRETKQQLDRLERARAAQKRAGLSELEAQLARQEQRCRELEQTAKQLPSEEQLHRLRQQLDRRESALQTAKMEAAFYTGSAEKPQVLPCFAGLSGEEALLQAKADQQRYATLTAPAPQRLTAVLIVCLLLLGAGIGLCFFSLIIGLSLAGLGLLGTVFTLLLRSWGKTKKWEKAHQAELILLRYGVRDPLQFLPLAEAYGATMARYEKEAGLHEAQRLQLAEARAAAESALEESIRQVQQFAPDCRTAQDCREALSAALSAHSELLSGRRQAEAQRRQYEALRPVLGGSPEDEVDQEALHFDEAKLLYEKRSSESALSKLCSGLDQIRGALSAMGDPVTMEAEAEQLREQIDRDTLQLEVMDIAMAALQEADEELRSRFSPRITAEAGKLLAAMTGEKYPTLLLDPELQLSVREAEGTVMRPAAAMSCGTADQMYLALRLAMSHQLLPEQVPLILDDALVNFDDARTRAAIALLKQEAKDRQVILFTCRSLPQ